MALSDYLFTFDHDTDEALSDRTAVRSSKISELIDLPCRPEAVSPAEKPCLISQYKTLFLYAHSIYQKLTVVSEAQKNEEKINHDVWYELLSNEKYHSTIKDILEISLRFLNRDQNECPVESLYSSIGNVEKDGRYQLKHETSVKQTFIRINGPHILLSKQLRRKALDEMFLKDILVVHLHLPNKSEMVSFPDGKR